MRTWQALVVALALVTAGGCADEELSGARPGAASDAEVAHAVAAARAVVDAWPARPAGRRASAHPGAVLTGPFDRAELAEDGTALTLRFTGATGPASTPCGEDYRGEPVVGRNAVTVLVVRSARHPYDGACSAAGAQRSVEVDLPEPLGSRPVVDLGGTPVDLLPVALPPEFGPACGVPGSAVDVSLPAVVVRHTDCDLTGVALRRGNQPGGVVPRPGEGVQNEIGFVIWTDEATLDVTFRAPG